jgi:hypothetical protein
MASVESDAGVAAGMTCEYRGTETRQARAAAVAERTINGRMGGGGGGATGVTS